MATLIISICAVITVVFLAFAVLLRRHIRLSNIIFALSLLTTAAVIFGDIMCVYQPDLVMNWKRGVFINEAIMAPLWFLFCLSFARGNFWENINIFNKVLLLISPAIIFFPFIIPVENFFYSPKFDREGMLYLDNAGYTFNLLLLFYSIFSIVAIEALLRSSSGTSRWTIKYFLIGVGGILSINIFYYSHALLYRSMNMNLLPVRAGIILTSALFISYSFFRQKVMDIELAISRQVLYRSLSILTVGIYFIGLGILGEGMKYLSPEVRKNITIYLGFAGVLVIIAMILSDRLRQKAMVMINKNFYSHKYDYRTQWLEFTQQISLKHSLQDLLDAIAYGFKNAIGSKGAAIWLKDKGKGQFVCVKTINAVAGKSAPSKELLEFFKNEKWILNVHDPKCSKMIRSSSEFIRENRVSLLVPLFIADELTGFVILLEGLAKTDYNYEDYDLLKTLARQATVAILNAKLSEELIEAKEMEAIGRLSSFVIHDLKNASSMLSMIAQNAEEHIDNPEFQKDAIKAIAGTSSKIQDITEKLKNIPKKESLTLQYCDLGSCVRTAIKEFKLNGKFRLNFNEIEPVSTKCDREEIKKVIINLIMNALDAIDNCGEIIVSIGKENDMACIKVSDNGCGMSRDFIEQQLFKPFRTTKKKGLGIGLYQSKTIIDEHSGRIQVVSEEGKGTDFHIYLPLHDSWVSG